MIESMDYAIVFIVATTFGWMLHDGWHVLKDLFGGTMKNEVET